MSLKWAIAARLDPVVMLHVVGFLAESGIRKIRNGESFGEYGQTVLRDDVNYRVLRTRKK